MTPQSSIVLTVEVLHDGQRRAANYFVEHDVVHAKIGERVVLAPLLGRDAAETVTALLQEHLTKNYCQPSTER